MFCMFWMKAGIVKTMLCGMAALDGEGAPMARSVAAEPVEISQDPGTFGTPCWDPTARWQIERYASIGATGHLDGPRVEMEAYSPGLGARAYRPGGAGRYSFGVYDLMTGRGHVVAGSARGYLDGPFSRARVGGWDYNVRSQSAASPDGRYFFFTDGYNGGVLRRLDFENQDVRTMLPDARSLKGLAVDSKSKLLVLKATGELAYVMPDGTTGIEARLTLGEVIGGWGASLALDETNGRLYATTYGTKNWYVWYWDLKDGSFHGVLPIAAAGAPKRAPNEAGSFDGVSLYNEGTVTFGPDDPERRFLYLGRIDTWTWFRLDLKARWVWVLSPEGASNTIDWSGGIVRFKDSGTPGGNSPTYGGGVWLANGSFIGMAHSPFTGWLFKRIK